MILTCPSCSTRFLVDPVVFGPKARAVRCARCSHQWTQEPLEDEIPDDADPAEDDFADDFADDSPDDDDVEIIRGPQEATPIPPGSNLPAVQTASPRRRGWVGWAALVVVLFAIGASSVVFRDRIVAAWPPATMLYELAEAPFAEADDLGLRIGNVVFDRSREAGQPVLRVTGDVTNISEVIKEVPRIRVALEDENKRVLFHWTVSLAKSELDPGAVVPFSTRLPNPPANARSLSVTFITEH